MTWWKKSFDSVWSDHVFNKTQKHLKEIVTRMLWGNNSNSEWFRAHLTLKCVSFHYEASALWVLTKINLFDVTSCANKQKFSLQPNSQSRSDNFHLFRLSNYFCCLFCVKIVKCRLAKLIAKLQNNDAAPPKTIKIIKIIVNWKSQKLSRGAKKILEFLLLPFR